VKWRVINEGEHSEAMHHAIDEVLLEQLNDGEMQPTLRFWYRPHTTIPMGRFQAYHDEVEHEYIKENDIEVVRRITGGGAMFSEPGNVITYSIYIPADQVNSDIEESYSELDNFAVEALREMGADVDYVPLNDIEHEEGKIGGAAQIRKENAVLHHTMMSYDMNTKRMLKALRIGKEKVSDKAIKSAEKRVSRISDHIDHSREEVIQKLIESFMEEKEAEWEEGSLTEEELSKAEELAEDKFSTAEWNQKL
jgi:lipoate-protein ligase A